jgi:SAM-dependent methyltransferase
VDHLLRATAAAEARHFWFRGFRWFVRPLVRRATRDRRGARILDCGCGTGANIEWLRRFGLPYGFDLTPAGLYIGRAAGRRNLVRARVEEVPFPDGSFDLVTSFDVLYALEPDAARAAVAEMFRLARPGGWAIVNVAAMPVLRGDHSILSRELRRYTRRELRGLLEGAGFEIAWISHTNQTLFLPMLAARSWHRRRGLASEPDATAEIRLPPAPINAALTALLFLESLWVRIVPGAFGSSLLALARKPASADA